MLTHTEGGFGGPSSSSVELENHAPARFWFVRCCVTVRGGGGEKRNTGADGRVRVDLFLATFDCFFFFFWLEFSLLSLRVDFEPSNAAGEAPRDA